MDGVKVKIFFALAIMVVWFSFMGTCLADGGAVSSETSTSMTVSDGEQFTRTGRMDRQDARYGLDR